VLAAIAGGAGAFVLVVTSDHMEAKAVWSIFGPAVGWSFVGTGLYAWRQRPGQRCDTVMWAAFLSAAVLPFAFPGGLLRSARARADDPLRGLEPALPSLASRAPEPVTLEADADERQLGPVEAYFVVSEALANVAKYAPPTHATVVVRRLNGRVTVEISDNGAGGADAARGSGLSGLADRVAALDGTISLDSPAGRGTRLHGGPVHALTAGPRTARDPRWGALSRGRWRRRGADRGRPSWGSRRSARYGPVARCL